MKENEYKTMITMSSTFNDIINNRITPKKYPAIVNNN